MQRLATELAAQLDTELEITYDNTADYYAALTPEQLASLAEPTERQRKTTVRKRKVAVRVEEEPWSKTGTAQTDWSGE